MKNSGSQFVSIVSCLILLAGCAGSSEQYTWINSSPKNNTEQARAAAESECLSKAYTTFVDQAAINNSCIGLCINKAGGISNGFTAGSAARRSREIRDAREHFYESCMLSKGWKKQLK